MSALYSGTSGPPGPAPAPQGTLPYPYVTQYDPEQHATFYANTETGETSWDLPEQVRQGGDFDPGPSGDGPSSSGPHSIGDPGHTQQSTAAVSGGRGHGEAASFYAASGAPTATANPGAVGGSDQPQGSTGTRAFGSEQDERGQFGKLLGGSGVAAMAWKLYKDYRNCKHNQQQFRPPNGRPSGFTGMSGGRNSMYGVGNGPSMFPVAGAMGGNHYGHQQYVSHGRPDDRMSSAGGLLSSLLDGGSRPHGGSECSGMYGGAGMQGRPSRGGYNYPAHHGSGGGSGAHFGGPPAGFAGPGGGRGRGRW